ncbi:MAG: sodium-dependent transporter [Lachnospiraceae bacterium]|nr:sodium-dependent transporter [Lachnospiraceae bacterium]
MSEHKKSRSSFSGGFGFVLAAAGSAVGLGNIWRFPYLAAKHQGGTFIFVYIILALTFGFALLTTEIAIGRKTKQGPLTAYENVHNKFKFNGWLAWIVPVIILPYYCSIGGWVLKYLKTFITMEGEAAAQDTFFTGYLGETWTPLIWMIIFLALTAFVVISGVEKGIEKYSKVLMPILLLLVIGISIFALTLSNTAEDGTVRTGMDGLKIYLTPDFSGMTVKGFIQLILDAVGQLFFSISVAMGIMVAYGSYVKDDTNLMKSINQIEFFDTFVALLAGLMIVPAVYVFKGMDGMSAGPGLMFVSLPKVFSDMGTLGVVIGILFFLMVTFAAVTSSVSVMEAIVSGIMDKWKISRTKSAIIATVYSLVLGIIVCLGFNVLAVDIPLPGGSSGSILDVMDYISNSVLMPFVALVTCIFIGWIVKPKYIVDEVTKNGEKFGRKTLYNVMIKFIAPVILFILLLQAFGLLGFLN